jgi:hypothetical protein
MDSFLNNTGEFGKYILQDLMLPSVHATPEAIAKYEKAGRKRILWMDGNVMPVPFQINTAWYYSANHEYMDKWASEDKTVGRSHVHDFDELLCFYGSDPFNPYNLCGEVEIWLHGEKHILTKSSLIFIPAGMPHLPLYVNRVDRPIFHFSLLLNREYEFKCENGESFRAK